LYNIIGNTYGGDAENFNMPNLVDKFIQGSTTSGTDKEAGLPNITGSISNSGSANDQFLTDSTSTSIKTAGALSIAGYASKTSMANGTDSFNTPTGFGLTLPNSMQSTVTLTQYNRRL
jgi:microcystin-dependent protein